MEKIATTYTNLGTAYPFWFKLGRFCISGGAGAAINIGILFLLTHIFSVWYLLSSVIAFLISFCASFIFQKFWTFGDTKTERLHVQAGWYLIVAVVNLALNISIMYALVEWAGFHYIGAQLISSATIALESYFAYQAIFKASQQVRS